MNDYWSLDSILASEFELTTNKDKIPLWKAIPLLDQLQIQIPTMYQLSDLESNAFLNLHSFDSCFWDVTKLLSSKMYIF